jgi:hypothetical protein
MKIARVYAFAFSILFSPVAVLAQSTFGTITGTVSDSSGAVVQNAAVQLANDLSGDARKSATNNDGYYSFSSVPAGKYKITIEAAGFTKTEQIGIELQGAQKLNFNLTLQVGQPSATQVNVVGTAEQIVPVDSGEKAAVLTQKQLQDFSVVGRSAAEFIKVLPGFAIAGTGTENRSNFSGEVIGINGNGDGGSQSALNNAFAGNGLSSSNIDITADGAHVSDPGCNCATPVNPNTDMIEEFKVLASNFSAENAKGPLVINSIAKSGGKDFHGEGYFYARHFSMNANDALNNKLGIARPESKYFFPGGNIGGPVLLPGTKFNHNRDKLFFFSGFEYYFQTLDTGVLTATVPTPGMLGGNFSPAELAKLGAKTASGGAPQTLNSTLYPTGIIPSSQIDPNGVALLKLYPAANADSNLTGGYNWVRDINFDQNSRQWMSKVDYNISDKTKLFVRYNLQTEKQLFPVGLWWRNGQQVPYPTSVQGKNRSDSVSTSLVHTFSPTLTNEFVFGYTYIDFPNTFEDPKKVDRSAVGFNFAGIYKNGVAQIPAITGWGGEFATLFNPGGFEVGGGKGLYADKYLPSISDNISKVWGTHTSKFGFYYEWVRNVQPANGYTNGIIAEANWASNTTGSAYADLVTGRVANYQEQNFNNLHDEAFNTTEFFATDSWKISKRLTLDYGLRVSHYGAWYDRTGNGFSIFDPKLYNAAAPTSSFTGFTWNKKTSSVPLGGYPTRSLFWAPRFGLAYDLFGTGKTVLRGGLGQFYYHTPQSTQGLDLPAGAQAPSFSNTTLAALVGVNPGLAPVGGGAVASNDDHSPLTTSYSFTVSQKMPGASLLEVAYVGSQSKYLANANGVGTNINVVPYGTLFNVSGDVSGLGDGQYKYGLYPTYQAINVANHNLFSNYNSMQISWVRQSGRYDYSLNYTYGKALGIVGLDQLNLANDYGALAFDRRHVFNAAYSIELPNLARTSKVLKGAANGWQFSGITQIQSGVNLTANAATNNQHNFNLNANGFKAANGYDITNQNLLGTNFIPLQPILTCDPTSGLKANQYINPSCFSLPTQRGKNGPIVLPEIFGPTYWNSDLSLFKNFQMGEHKKLQFRFQAYNFLNHSLVSFRNGTNTLNLNYNQTTGKLDNNTFGVATEKQGHRIVQLAVKFYF